METEREQKWQLTTAQALRCRVRYLTDGAVLGSENFVNAVFDRHRPKFGKPRESGARAMREADWGGLCVLRDLQGDVMVGQ